MNRNKRILISLCISLLLLIVFNIVYKNIEKSDEVKVYVLNENLVKGELIEKSKLKEITLAKNMVDNILIIQNMNMKLYAKYDLKIGQVLTEEVAGQVGEEKSDSYEYISIPIETPHDAVGYLLNRGDRINIYYTSKISDTNNILINTAHQVYSSQSENSLITTKLFDNIGVIDIVNNVGTTDRIFTQIIIKVNKDEVSKIVCLKQFGTFTISLAE